jgi:hypothetical protein
VLGYRGIGMTHAAAARGQSKSLADFASATQDVLYGMGVVMAVAAVVAVLGLRRGVQQATAPETATAPTSATGVPRLPE